MAEEEFDHRPFATAANDPLAAEHRAVSNWVESACRSLDGRASYCDIALKSLPGGQILLDSRPVQAKRYVRAAIVQSHHWDLEARRILYADAGLQGNLHQLPDWRGVSGRRRQTLAVVSALMRRALPFESGDLLVILSWCNGMTRLSEHDAPLRAITRAVERYEQRGPLEFELREALRQFAIKLRDSRENGTRRLATTVEQLLAHNTVTPESNDEGAPSGVRPVRPAASGNPAILTRLKRELGMIDSSAPAAVSDRVGPDHFELLPDSPLRIEHALLSDLFREAIGRALEDRLAFCGCATRCPEITG